jgi:division protein CdvB (Snf7/Vps24/ESCRT-III family)
MKNARQLARLIHTARTSIERLETSKAQLESVAMQVGEQVAMASAVEALGESASVMAGMSQLMNVPEVAATMRTLAVEMGRAGLIQETSEDLIDTAMEMAEESGEVDEDEVDAVIAGVLGVASPTPAAAAPAVAASGISLAPVASGTPTASALSASEVEAEAERVAAAGMLLPAAPSSLVEAPAHAAPAPLAPPMGAGGVSMGGGGGGGSGGGGGGGGGLSDLESRLAALST